MKLLPVGRFMTMNRSEMLRSVEQVVHVQMMEKKEQDAEAEVGLKSGCTTCWSRFWDWVL